MKRKITLLLTTIFLCTLSWSQSAQSVPDTPLADQKMQHHPQMQKRIGGDIEQGHQRFGFGRGMGHGSGFGVGMGRGHGGPKGSLRWWKNAEMAKHIGLTAAQDAQMDKIWQDARLKSIDLRADAQKQQALLLPLLESDTPDEAKILQQMDRVSAAHSALTKSAVSEHLAMHKVLTPDQIKQLKVFHAEHAHRRMQMNMRRPGPAGNQMHRFRVPNGSGDNDEEDDDINN